MKAAVLLIPASMLLVSMPADSLAQDAERYQLERTDDGYVRLDSRTGRMSLCREQGDQLVCRYATDESRAYVDDIDSLRDRVEALEERLAALEGGSVPSEEEFEQGLNYMERFMRRFMGIVQDFEERFGNSGDEPTTPEPDRT